MDNSLFTQWCREATRLIRFTPDRQAVYAELMAHLEDHRDALMESGAEEKEATKEALNAMGNAWDVAHQLAEIHKPFWGFAHWITRTAAIALSALTLLTLVIFIGNVVGFLSTQGAPDSINPPANGSGWKLIHEAEIRASDYSDGYWLRISSIRLWQSPKHGRSLCFQLQALHLPAQRELSAHYLFWAMDNQGNYYTAYASNYAFDRSIPYLVSADEHSASPVGHCINMELNNIPDTGIQWIELHYDRDGRDISLRIPLTGGDAP